MKEKAPIKWVNLIVLTLTPLTAITVIPIYAWYTGFTWVEWLYFAIFMMATGLAITGGYHRLWSHRAYDAHPLLRLFYAVFGAAAVQNTVIHWCSDHRRHHKYVDDNERDPYSAGRGFWFSHMGWILRDHKSGDDDFSNVKDLERDPIVRWQHRYYLPIVLTVNVGLPLLLGFLHGRLWGVFLLAGILRLVINHHFTFAINSFAHILGNQPYSDKNSARDNMLMAFFTYGEGYHNFHHAFQADYRNGIRWWQFDPTKWLIKTSSYIGLAHGLKRTKRELIEKARISLQFKKAIEKLSEQGHPEDWRVKVEQTYQQFNQALNEWMTFKKKWMQAKRNRLREKLEWIRLREQYLQLRANLELQRKTWRLLTAPLT